MNNALYNASYHDPGIRREDISIIAPCFFTEADSKSGAVTDDTLLWRMTTWIDGKANVSPGYFKVSSFDVLDALVSYYMDTTTFPNLKVSFPTSFYRSLATCIRPWSLEDIQRAVRWPNDMQCSENRRRATTVCIFGLVRHRSSIVVGFNRRRFQLIQDRYVG